MLNDSIFKHLFHSLSGAQGIAVLISAYFDESAEGDGQDRFLSVSGYVLNMSGVDGLETEWTAMLDKYELPYFHMAECNSGTGNFSNLTDDECDKCAREAIRIARKYVMHGHATIMDQSEYRRLFQNHGFDCDPYSFLVWTEFIHVNSWVSKNHPDARISLFFEAGYKTEPRANELLAASVRDVRSEVNRVSGYSFVKKQDSYPTQAADLLVWNVRKGFENIRNGMPVRKDTQALIDGKKTILIEYTEDFLKRIRSDLISNFGSLKSASRLIFE